MAGHERIPPTQQFKVLVIDDEPAFLEMVQLALSMEGFSVIVAQNPAAGLRAAYQSRPDIILLDVMMPDMDGYEICRRLREMTDAPIIFVTAKGSPEDVLQGFSLGADDYLTKPFEISELLCRLRVALRRATQQHEKPAHLIFITDSLMLDSNQREVIQGNQVIRLTPLEYEVLALLVRHRGKVLSADAILTHVWGHEQLGNLELVKQYIYRLRQKIEPNPQAPIYLHTVWGEGYYFDVTQPQTGERSQHEQ